MTQNTVDFLGALAKKAHLMATNPARAILEDITALRTALTDHNQNCTACKRPKKKARAALIDAYSDVCDVMMESVHRQVHDACLVLTGQAETDQDGKTLARAAAATAQNTLMILRLLTVRIHDAEPDFTAFDHMAEAMTRLADAIDVNNAKTKRGLN